MQTRILVVHLTLVVTHVEGNKSDLLLSTMADETNRFLQRLRLILQQRQLCDAMRVLNDETHGGDISCLGIVPTYV
jgi:hypothetical protein